MFLGTVRRVQGEVQVTKPGEKIVGGFSSDSRGHALKAHLAKNTMSKNGLEIDYMNKKMIGMAAIGCLLFAQQASASLVTALDGYMGPLYFDLSGYSKSLDTGGETWGVVTVNGVFKDQAQTVANRLWGSEANDQIYGMFYGLTDNYITPTSTGFSIGQEGGSFALYGVPGDVDLMLGPSGRTGNTYAGMGSNLLFEGNFDSGVDPSNNAITVIQTVLNDSSPTVGEGVGYGSVTGGSLYAQLDSDSIVDSTGGIHDLLFSFNVNLPTEAAAAAGWSQSLTDPIEANAVPEPASVLLFGAGLIGAAGISRRKFNAKKSTK